MNDQQFIAIIDATPLVSVDLILHNTRGEILLGKRNNKPAQGYWFVPGGRIRKNETIDHAIERIAEKELGLNLKRNEMTLLGVYDHIYEDNYLGQANVNTHYVVLGFQATIENRYEFTADEQHEALRWWSKQAILADPHVHQNTKNYFNKP